MAQINLEHREVVNEQLDLGPGSVYFLGPGLTLRGCTLVLKCASRNLIVPQARFVDCSFVVKRELKDFRWDKAHFQGCRFSGRMSGNDFGEWPDSPGQGSIEGCDFTQAYLDGCRFFGCDVRTLQFPAWPCFTLLEPARGWHELSAIPWPGKHGPIIAKGFAENPPSTVALTYAAPELAKFCGTTPEAIKALLEQLDGVHY